MLQMQLYLIWSNAGTSSCSWIVSSRFLILAYGMSGLLWLRCYYLPIASILATSIRGSPALPLFGWLS